MKKLVCIFLFLTFYMALSAQNVGINSTGATPNSSAMLDVSSTNMGLLIPRINIPNLSAAAPVTSPEVSLLVYNTNATTGVGYYYWTGTEWMRFAETDDLGFVDGSGVATRVAFWSAANTLSSNANLFWNNTSNRLGIGTTTPSTTLDVNGLTTSAGYRTRAGNTDYHQFTRNGAGAAVYINQEDAVNPILRLSSATATANANVRFTVENNGNVGIGTTSPSAQLHTTGTVRFANYPSGANGAIVRTDANGNIAVTNFTGNASQVLLGNGTFGTATTSGTAWQLTGNSGTSAATNFIGTTDAIDFVVRTANTERMRVVSGGNVLINATSAFNNTDALEVVVSPTFTTGLGAYGNGGYPVWGQQISAADHAIIGVNSAASGAGAGCGIVGISSQTSGAGVWGDGGTSTRGVLGFTNNASRSAIQAQNHNAGGDAIYAVNSAANGASAGSAIYATSGQTGGQTIGATLQSTTVYINTCISGVSASSGSTGIIGVSSSNTGTGLRGINSAANGSAIGFGGFFSSNQTGGASLASCLRGVNYYPNTAVSGVVVSSVSGGIGVIGGCDNETGIGVQGQSTGTTGRGVIGLVTQNSALGVYGQNTGASGTAVAGAGNNTSPSTLVSGSGGAFTGSTIGVYGYAANEASNVWGGYFANVWEDYAYVGGYLEGTIYKINGVGSVSTIVDRPDGSKANMFCPEAPEILFQDYGSGKLIDGKAHIVLDEIFSNNIFVDENYPLRVFIQLEGDCNGVYVSNKTQYGFDVIELQNGNSNVDFSWTVTAVRADSKNENGDVTSKHIGVRFPDSPKPLEVENFEIIEVSDQKQYDSESKPIEKRNVENVEMKKNSR